jgi:hypothetical protein
MTIDLHPEAITRLRELIIEGLGTVRVRNNSVLDYRSLGKLSKLDAALPDRKSAVRRQLEAYISEEPISDFVADVLARGLSARPYGRDTVVPLTRLREYSDRPKVAEEILNAFTSLPQHYALLVEIPDDIGRMLHRALGQSQIQLSRSMRLLLKHPEAPQEFPQGFQESQRTSLLGLHKDGIAADEFYVQANVSGYLQLYGTSTPFQDFQDTVKSIYGLLVANVLVSIKAYYFAAPRTLDVLAYVDNGGTWKPYSILEFGSDAGNEIKSLGLDPRFMKLKQALQDRIIQKEVGSVVLVYKDSVTNERLIRGAQWLFESYIGSNQLLQYVQATVAAEILLGEKSTSDLIGIGELLGNRCAYLIGTSKSQREQILTDFRRIYDTRSRIVHQGHNRLSLEQRSDLATLRWMVSRVIQEEVKLLAADEKLSS